jgi:hypothetical protein
MSRGPASSQDREEAMTTRNSTPSVVSTSRRGEAPTLIRRPQRGPAGRIAAIAAGVTLLATALGPLVPGASALELPPRSVVISPLPKAADLQVRLPDLAVDFVVVRNDTDAASFPVSRGADLDLIAMHRNDGFGDAPLSTTRFALVREPSLRLPIGTKVAPPAGDATGGALSVTLGEVTIPAIEAGRADFPFIEGGSWRFTVPADVRGGTYRVRACADAPGAIREGLEDNNCRLSDQRLQIGA